MRLVYVRVYSFCYEFADETVTVQESLIGRHTDCLQCGSFRRVHVLGNALGADLL